MTRRAVSAVCPPATYKSVSGPGGCLACPEHSRAERSGSDVCACEPGYWRAETDPPQTACTRESGWTVYEAGGVGLTSWGTCR